jgi:hypothetical protein
MPYGSRRRLGESDLQFTFYSPSPSSSPIKGEETSPLWFPSLDGRGSGEGELSSSLFGHPTLVLPHQGGGDFAFVVPLP